MKAEALTMRAGPRTASAPVMPVLAHAALALHWHNICLSTKVTQVYQRYFAQICEGIE